MEEVKEIKSNKLNRSAKHLIASDLIYNVTALFAETFLVAYFLQITGQNITKISLYFIVVYGVKAILQLFIGRFIKTNPNVRTKILSIGIVIRALFILFIFLLGDNLATNFIIVAIIFGFSETLYWATHELIFIDVTTNDNRRDYMSIKKILGRVIKIVAPIALGSSIELYSFSKVAIYVFILSVVQIIISMQINPKDFSTNNHGEKYSLKKYLSFIKENRVKRVKQFYSTSFVFGIILDALGVIVTIITVMTFQTSFNLGVLTTVFAFLSIISLYLYKKCDNMSKYKKLLWVCSVLVVISVVGLLLDISRMTLVIYNFAYTIGIAIFDAAYNTKKGDLVKECNIEKWNVEYVMLGEVFTELGRVFGFTLMFIAGLTGSLMSFKILLLFVTLCVPVFTRVLLSVDADQKGRF